MRKVAAGKSSKPVQWVAMRHEADCWIAACAMAVGMQYEEAEKAFGSGVDYSAATLSTNDDPDHRRLTKIILMLRQCDFFADHGYYPLLIPYRDPVLKRGRRYLLSATAPDPERPWMGHTIVVDEEGRVFDPEPNYDPANPKYSIGNYSDLLGWEIVGWDSD